MSTIRIAVASTPLTATLDEAVPAAVAAVEEAGRLGARIVCLPETGLPGHRDQPRPVPDVSADALDAALREVAAAARRAGVVTIVGAERPTPAGREIVSVVFDADGTRLGEQAKTQIDPTEEAHYVPGAGRRVFTAAGVTFGIAICHEAFRYPEISRSLVLAGAQVIFVPHFVITDDGSLPSRWCDASNPYNEKAIMLPGAREHGLRRRVERGRSRPGLGHRRHRPGRHARREPALRRRGRRRGRRRPRPATRRLALRWAPERSLPA